MLVVVIIPVDFAAASLIFIANGYIFVAHISTSSSSGHLKLRNAGNRRCLTFSGKETRFTHAR